MPKKQLTFKRGEHVLISNGNDLYKIRRVIRKCECDKYEITDGIIAYQYPHINMHKCPKSIIEGVVK